MLVTTGTKRGNCRDVCVSPFSPCVGLGEDD